MKAPQHPSNVHTNSFVKRQVADSRFGHQTIGWDPLCALVFANWANHKPGYREGVVLVPVQPEGFFSSTIELAAGMPLKATYEARREGETPRLHVGLDVDAYEAAKQPAVAVDIVMYASTVLAEDGGNELPAEPGNWEVVSVNPRLCVEDEPIKPSTLMANHFQDDGGTATGMSDSEFVEALRVSRAYWNDKVSLG